MPPGRCSGCKGCGYEGRGRAGWRWQQPGKWGSRFSFYFYLGTRVCRRCSAEAPGDALPSPAGARYHLCATCLSLSRCQTSWQRAASSEALGHPARTSAWAMAWCVGREGAGEQSHVLQARLSAGQAPLSSSRAEAGNTSSQLTRRRRRAALSPAHRATTRVSGQMQASLLKPGLKSMPRGGVGCSAPGGKPCNPTLHSQPTRRSAGAGA